MPPPNDSIRELIRRTRRRFFFNVGVAQAVLAGIVGMAGAVLILLFGAQFLDWRWLAALALVTFPLAFFRTARRVPGPYRVAQIVDERLRLCDSLSTAFYFSELAGPERGARDVRQAQFAASERMVSHVDPRVAVPLTAPPSLYILGCLFLAGAVLFGIRYGVQRKMDLDKPLARVLIDAFGGSVFERRAAALKKSKKSIVDIWGQTAVDTMDGPETQYKDGEDLKGQEFLDAAKDGVLSTVDVPEVDKGINEADPGQSKNKSDGKGSGESPGEEGESSESAKGAPNQQGNEKGGGSKQGENAAGKQPPNSNGEPSLAAKIKDAMSSLMASMRSKATGQNSQQTAGQSNGETKSQQMKGGQKAAGQGQKAGDPSESSEDGQPGEDGEGGKSADLKGSNAGSEGASSSETGSGAGQQEGAKDAKIAEQLAAMGKISEIIGKRSANVTGEVMIEVTSSKQPLRTPYSDSKATHGEAAGEISRDEVPAAFQDYVQQYFEQVRRPAKGPAKPAAPPAAAPRAAAQPPQ